MKDHELKQLLNDAERLVVEEETVARENVSDDLLAAGFRLRETIVRAGAHLDRSRTFLDAAGSLGETVLAMRERIERVLAQWKASNGSNGSNGSMAHASLMDRSANAPGTRAG